MVVFCGGMPLRSVEGQETFSGQYSSAIVVLTPIKQTPKLKLYLEGQLRLQARKSQRPLERHLLWTGLGYALNPKTSLWAAYGWTPNYNPQFTNEQRSFQQIIHVENIKGGELMLRGRLEERFIPNESTPLFWTRFMARYQRNFKEHPKFYWVLQNEVMFNANTINTNNKRGFGQALSFAGLGRHITPHVMAELGYAAAYFNSTNAALEHILMVNVFYFH
jgi:hypothetical protein